MSYEKTVRIGNIGWLYTAVCQTSVTYLPTHTTDKSVANILSSFCDKIVKIMKISDYFSVKQTE